MVTPGFLSDVRRLCADADVAATYGLSYGHYQTGSLGHATYQSMLNAVARIERALDRIEADEKAKAEGRS